MFALYLISDGARAEAIAPAVREALTAAPTGAVAVQLRAKGAGSRQLLQIGRALRAITRASGAVLLVNDRADIALAIEADGVHLPENGLPAEVARALLGPKALIGVSCHDALGLTRAAASGASFATLSPVFESPGKGPALGLPRFAELAAGAALPVYALGGVNAVRAPPLRAAGAAGLAVISAVFDAADRGAAVTQCLQAWQAVSEPASTRDTTVDPSPAPTR